MAQSALCLGKMRLAQGSEICILVRYVRHSLDNNMCTGAGFLNV